MNKKFLTLWLLLGLLVPSVSAVQAAPANAGIAFDGADKKGDKDKDKDKGKSKDKDKDKNPKPPSGPPKSEDE